VFDKPRLITTIEWILGLVNLWFRT